jgi:hypothetical protein
MSIAGAAQVLACHADNLNSPTAASCDAPPVRWRGLGRAANEPARPPPPPCHMKPLTRLLSPLGRAAKAFFTHDLALRREGEALQLVLEERQPAMSREAAAAAAAERRDAELLALMRMELKHVLDDLPGTRRSLRHLAFFEQVLATKGLRALHKVPVEVLARAHEQFESLVTNWSPVGLATLRSKMAVALLEREGERDAEAAQRDTAAVLDEAMPVPEVQTLDTEAEAEALAAAYAVLTAAPPTPSKANAGGTTAAAPAGATEMAPEGAIEFQPELPVVRAAAAAAAGDRKGKAIAR